MNSFMQTADVMCIDEKETTTDLFLGGKVQLIQPQNGYRATSDSVLVASAVKAHSGETILDVGTGSGVVALCVGARVKELCLTGIELQPQLAVLAEQNALLNKENMRVVCQNILAKKDELHGMQFHHVVSNPPFYTEDCPRKNAEQRIAYHEKIHISEWVIYCLKHVRPKGTLTLIHRPEILPEILPLLCQKLGGVEVIPILSKADSPAKRIIVRGVLGSKKPFLLREPVVMYNQEGRATDESERILRLGEGLFIADKR